MRKVSGIGNAVIDLFVSGTDESIAEAGLTKEGFHLVSLSEWTAYAKKFQMIFISPGGSMCNALSTLSLLGLKCQLVASIANDSFGTTLKTHFNDLNITLDNANVGEKDATGRALVIITPDNKRTLVLHLGASKSLSGRHVSMHPILGSKGLILEGYLVARNNSRDAIERGVEIAHIQNITSVFTLSNTKIVNEYREHFLRYADMNVDMIFGNAGEFGALFGTKTLEETVNACKRRDNLSVITQGKSGALLCQKDKVIEIPELESRKIIDKTGANDQFLAGFLAAYLKGAELAPAGRFGSVLSSAVIEQISGIFHRDIKDIVARASYS